MKLSPIKISSIVTCGLTLSAFGQAAAPLTNAPAPNPWVSSAGAGLTVTSGNTKTVQFNAEVKTERKWDHNEINLGAEGLYGRANGEKNADAIQGLAQYNRLFGERLFGYLRLDALHDAIADIDYRLALSPGAGYYFLKETNTTLRGELGPGYLYEKDKNASAKSYMTLRLAERLEHKISGTAKGWEAVEILPQVDKFENYILNAEIGVESAMTTRLALSAKIQDSYHSQPAAHRLKNDFKLITAINYKF